MRSIYYVYNMEPSVVNPKTKEQLNAISAFLRALNVNPISDDKNSDNTSPNDHRWFLNIKNMPVAQTENTPAKKKKNAQAKNITRELFE